MEKLVFFRWVALGTQTTLKVRPYAQQQTPNIKTNSKVFWKIFFLTHNVLSRLFFFNLTDPLIIYVIDFLYVGMCFSICLFLVTFLWLFFLCLVLFWTVCFYLIVIVVIITCLYSKESAKMKGCGFGWIQSGSDLGGAEEGEIVIKIDCMKK